MAELLPVGSRVVIERKNPSVGNWPRYQGRRGVIVLVNTQTFHDNSTYTEYGVSFGTGSFKNLRTDAFFKVDEVKPVLSSFQLNMGFKAL